MPTAVITPTDLAGAISLSFAVTVTAIWVLFGERRQ